MKVRALRKMLRDYPPDVEVYVRVGMKGACRWEAHSVSGVSESNKTAEELRAMDLEEMDRFLAKSTTSITIEGQPGTRIPRREHVPGCRGARR